MEDEVKLDCFDENGNFIYEEPKYSRLQDVLELDLADYERVVLPADTVIADAILANPVSLRKLVFRTEIKDGWLIVSSIYDELFKSKMRGLINLIQERIKQCRENVKNGSYNPDTFEAITLTFQYEAFKINVNMNYFRNDNKIDLLDDLNYEEFCQNVENYKPGFKIEEYNQGE